MNITLSPEQFEAVASPARLKLILAGAGSGKSRTLCAQIAHDITQGAAPSRMAAVTFTTKAAHELRERLGQACALRWVGTIHALCLSECHKWGVWRGRPEIIDEETMADLIDDTRASLRMSKTVSIAEVCAAFNSGETDLEMCGNPGLVAKLVRKRLIERNQTDMDLLLFEGARKLRQYAPEVDHLYWDEFQDSNPAEMAILTAFATRAACRVYGDPMQSIYAFRGSKIGNIMSLRTAWNAEFHLTENYRSLPQIVRVANELGGPAALTMRAMRDGDFYPGMRVTHRPFKREADELEFIRGWMLETRGTSRAILCRHNALAERIRIGLADVLPPRAPAKSWEMLKLALAICNSCDARRLTLSDWLMAGPPDSLLAALPWVKDHWTGDPLTTAASLIEAMNDEPQAARELHIGTIHSAKGLEFKHVLICGADQALIPGAKRAPEFEEERRLMYVAMTRAEDSLTFTSCEARAPLFKGQDVLRSTPSEFIVV